jgi:KDO2-lipid IV(A) lauroyltransferase
MSKTDWTKKLGQSWHYKGVAWRKLAYLGSRHAPDLWVKHSPGWFGVAFSVALSREREQIRRNLRLLFGERPWLDEQRDIAKTFVAYAHCLAESLGRDRPVAKAAKCVVHNEAVLSRLLADPKGFIIVTAHIGAWDVAAQVLMEKSGRDVLLVMDREPDEAARALQDDVRSRHGVKVAHVGADAFEGLALLKHLREGGVLAVQMDRPASSGRHVTVQFAGQPFQLPLGPFLLASLSQVPLVPLFVARRGYYEYDVRVGDAIRLPRRPSSAELDGAARDVSSLMEAVLREFPEQWFNFAASHRSTAPETEDPGSQ